MKISENWLREWVNPDIDTNTLVEQLTMAGLEVDSVEALSPELNKIVVAEVVECVQHPNADRLNLCQVNDGTGDHVQVVCGAKNVRAGLKVAFAQVGAELPGFKIGKAKLRGVESFGMICSEKELQMAESSEGILELPADAPVGQALTDYLHLDDQLIEIDLTPNRGDCLSIAGVARELGAINDLPVTLPSMDTNEAVIDDRFEVELVNPESCPHYTCRIIRGVKADAETPMWMREKLRRCGLRPISPVVDVTNYVMMELGQPMHGFDLNQLKGGIKVRNATANEKLNLLDGSSLECRDDTLLICDHEQGVALAGIMGGLESSVQDETVDILLESAFFAPARIAGKARSYGMHTDSSHRFERGVDPQLQLQAIERATTLLLDIVGGKPGPVVEALDEQYLPKNSAVVLRSDRLQRVLGIEVSNQQVDTILTNLEMEFTQTDEGWSVTGPSYRFDINIEADLIEEIGRIVGYNNIPGTREAAHVAMSSFSETRNTTAQMKDLMIGRGYYEAITYSFVSPEIQQLLDPDQITLSLANPISSDMSEMRTMILPGLVQALQHNLNRQQSRVRLFESGMCFIPQGDDLKQEVHFSAILTGDADAENWAEKGRKVDFYDIKGDLEALLTSCGHEKVTLQRSELSILHPGQSADVYINGELAGFIGALHPEVLKKLGINQAVYAFEMRLDSLQDRNLPNFEELSKFPLIRRDLALVLDQDTSAQELVDSIDELDSKIIRDVFVFDVYTGKELINNRKSIALGLILQDFSRTLTDGEVEQTVTEVLQKLEQQHKAVLR